MQGHSPVLSLYRALPTPCDIRWSILETCQRRIQDSPLGRGANPWGAPTYQFAGLSQKLHEIKKILVRGGGGGRRPPWIRHCLFKLVYLRNPTHPTGMPETVFSVSTKQLPQYSYAKRRPCGDSVGCGPLIWQSADGSRLICRLIPSPSTQVNQLSE